MLAAPRVWEALTRRIDSFLFGCALAIVGVGLVTLFSAADQSVARVTSQVASLGVRAGADVDRRQHPAADARARRGAALRRSASLLLVGVALFGVVVNGSRRWLNLGVARFQPSELMKIALPLMLAWYFQKFEGRIGWKDFALAAVLIVGAGLPDQAPARSRHGAADRARRASTCSTSPACRGRSSSGSSSLGARGRAARLAAPARLPARAHPHVHRPDARSARRRLSLVAGVDRARLGRRRRQGLAERHADAPRLPARAPHRFHLRRVRRGVRADRQRRAARALPAADRARA